LLDVFVSFSGNLYMVFELLDGDLKHLLDAHRAYAKAVEAAHRRRDTTVPRRPTTASSHPQYAGGLPLELARSYAFQMLAGSGACHSHRILHRDLKPHNLLFDKAGHMKLADFGLARSFAVPLREYTHEVVTLWYRPPEILLGRDAYSSTLDVWSIGCILVEMITGRPLFPGDSERDQIDQITSRLGTPTPEVWEDCASLPVLAGLHRYPLKKPSELCSDFAPSVKDLLDGMLAFDPRKRFTAQQAMKHPFFAGLDVNGAVKIAGACLALSPVPPIPDACLTSTLGAADPRAVLAPITESSAPHGRGSSGPSGSCSTAAEPHGPMVETAQLDGDDDVEM
jgi:serine/threonine protein kinase